MINQLDYFIVEVGVENLGRWYPRISSEFKMTHIMYENIEKYQRF